MAVSTQCPECSAPLKLKDELAGKNIKCPRCSNVFSVPSGNTAIAPAPTRPATPGAPGGMTPEELIAADAAATAAARKGKAAAPEEDDPLDFRPRGRDRDREAEEEEDAEADRTRQVEYEPCPKCEATGAERVLWTPWGSFYGPALLSHVRCPECGYAYNGRTGRSNTIAAIIFVTIPLLLIGAILGALYWYAFIYRYR